MDDIELRKENELITLLFSEDGVSFYPESLQRFAYHNYHFEKILDAIENGKKNALRSAVNHFLDTSLRFFRSGVELDLKKIGAPTWDGLKLSFVSVPEVAFENYDGDLPSDEEE